MSTTANITTISAAGHEAAEGADSAARARVDQAMAERINDRLGRTDLAAHVRQECGRILISWAGPVVEFFTEEDAAAIGQAKAECAALAQALADAGYTVTGHQTTHTFLSQADVYHSAFVAVAIQPQQD